MHSHFHLLAKPTGAVCNLDCKYCFFLSKEKLYPNSAFRMTDEMLEEYLKQYLASQAGPEVNVAWQGEPTLMGLPFFEKAIEFQKKYQRPGTRILNTIQTNGVLLDDAWCAFFRKHDYLVGLSLDGPRELHDAYRVDKGGGPTFDKVMAGLRCLQKHNVEFNVLTTVHAKNGDHPIDVYRFLRDEVGVTFMQFIPIVERKNSTGYQEGDEVTDRSVGAEQFGRFLIGIFDEWVKRDVGTVYVQMFDVSLAAWADEPSPLCVFSPTCGTPSPSNTRAICTPAIISSNRSICSATSGIVRWPRWSPRPSSGASGSSKQTSLPQYCRDCSVRFACHGGCPKDRFIKTPSGDPGLNYLCAGYKAFFEHVDEPMRLMAELLRIGRAPMDVMFAGLKPTDPCPCRTGKIVNDCHPNVTLPSIARTRGATTNRPQA